MGVPAALWTVGKWILSNGPGIVDLDRTYGPPTLAAYRTHGLKPAQIIRDVWLETSKKKPEQLSPAKTKRKKLEKID